MGLSQSTPIYTSQLQGRNIRLLEILPGEGEDPLQCRLIEVALDNAPDYLCLSYVWGSSSERDSLTCNGQPMQVTISLAQALRKLRLSRLAPDDAGHGPASERNSQGSLEISTSTPKQEISKLLVWADAICINQDDIVERSSQVQLMRDIYSMAAKVVVWLGPHESDQTHVAVSALELVALFLDTYQQFAADMKNKGIEWNNQGKGHFTFELCRVFLQSKNIENPWPILRELFSLPYWSRIWCVQEVYLAKDTTFMYGNAHVDGKSMKAFAAWFERESYRRTATGQPWTPEQEALRGTAISNAWKTLDYRRFVSKDLFLVCTDYRSHQATDLRDKVYGVLGLWHPESADHPNIVVDYNKNVAQVYTDVVIQAILAKKSLFVLRFVSHGPDHDFDNNEGFPSWVPRWDQGEPYTFSWLDKSPLSATMFQAEPPDEALARSGVLSVKGVLFDQIVWVSNILTNKDIFKQDAQLRQDLIRLWLEATEVKPTENYPRQISVVELATTLSEGLIKISDDLHDKDIVDPNAWLDMSDLDTDTGRAFISKFQQFMDSDKYPGDSQAFRSMLAATNRRLFRTKRGYIGMARSPTQQGDLVAVLHGGGVPFVLRLKGEPPDAYCVLVGDCFVHHIMNREVYDMLKDDGVMTGVFNIH